MCTSSLHLRTGLSKTSGPGLLTCQGCLALPALLGILVQQSRLQDLMKLVFDVTDDTCVLELRCT